MPIRILTITGLSLLLGAAALAVGLRFFFGPHTSDGRAWPAIQWNASTARAVAGKATYADDEMQIVLEPNGGAVVSLQMPEVPAQAYPYLHIELVDPPAELTLAVTWRAQGTYHALTLEGGTQKSLWIATEELQDWDGRISSLGLLLHDQPGETVRIRDFSIYPAALRYQLAAIFTDLTRFSPWDRAAMNTYTGVFQLSSYYPVVLSVALLGLSLLAYGLLLLVFRRRVPASWSVAALLFLACWVALDLAWQTRLIKQVSDTQRLFAGKDTEAKRAAGPDAALVELVSGITPLLDADEARVFVASTDQYSGMRVAYYLYPRNAFWSMHLHELPVNSFLRSGDYIALVNPTDFRFNEARGALVAPGRAKLSAQLLYSSPAGSLLRLN